MKKNVVKILSIVLVLVVAVSCIVAFTACGNKGANGDVVKYLDINLSDEDYAFAIQKTDATLKTQMNNFIAKIKSNGKLDEIFNNYASGNVTEVVSVAETTPNALIVATNAAFPPFEYKNGSKLFGIDMEIAKLFAQEIGRPLCVKDMAFAGVVPAVQNGNAHIGMAGLTITPDRQLVVDFSNSYYKSSQVVITKTGDTYFDGCTTKEQVEAKLAELANGTKVAAQNGTTGQFYIEGDEDFGFTGFKNLTYSGYGNAALAVQDMINGNVSYVIVDKGPAIQIVNKINQIN